MFDFYNFAANGACPERPSWQLTEKGYAWAKEVMGTKPTRKQLREERRKRQQALEAEEATFRFELEKTPKHVNQKSIITIAYLPCCKVCKR